MNARRFGSAVLLWEVALLPSVCLAVGLESTGNTDGVLTWNLGTIGPDKSAREVVLLASGNSPDALARQIDAARRDQAQPWPSAAHRPAPAGGAKAVWIANAQTDFALHSGGFFRWDWTGRQSLRCTLGGQISQFTWYVHWRDQAGSHRAGTPHIDASTPENLRVVDPVHALGPTEAAGVLETSDRKMRISVRPRVGPGSLVAVEFVVSNLDPRPLADVRLSAYANIEAAHTHTDDLSALDRRTAGLLVFDPPTGRCVVMTGWHPPATGHSGTWNSLEKLQAAEGTALDQWKPFSGLPPETAKRVVARLNGYHLPWNVERPTPDTRRLTADEARAVLDRDWLFQAQGQAMAERAKAEIGWARELAARLVRDPKTPSLKAELENLDRLSRRLGKPVDAGRAQELYFAVRQVKRRIAMANPVLDFSRLLFIDQPDPEGYEARHEAIHRMGMMAVPGGRLLVLDGLRPDGAIRRLAPDKPGSFWRADLSFDARRVLFCYKPRDEKSFHLYEMNLDGTGLRQLTRSDYDDVDPIYLPDGHILFTTTRGNSHVRCGPFIYSYILARCDADGGNIYLISCNGEPDFVPALLNDGRVIYSRWEYSDKPLWRLQKLWTTNQDGTGTAHFWGNQSVWPDHLSEPMPIPGSRRVMFSGVGHHDWWSGSIGIVDPDHGRDVPYGLTKVTADRPWPEVTAPPAERIEAPDYHPSGAFTGYKTAYPLSEQDFLVSARGVDNKFRLYLMDVHGNRELIYEGAYNIWHAMPVRARPVPPCQPDRVVWPGTGKDRKPVEPGVFFSADVLQGSSGLPREKVKYLRVWQLDYKTYSTWKKTYRHSGPTVSIVQEEGVKRILSEVPVEADGSVHFTAPAGRSLFFQLLDADRRCLQTMRSFTGVMPGERRGCVGCHEAHSSTPPRQGGLALRREPTRLTPPPWGTESVGYERFVQPVLDRYCVKCHQGKAPGAEAPNLALRAGHGPFQEPYLTLVGPAAWGYSSPANRPGYGIAGAIPVESAQGPNDPAGLTTLRPMQYLSAASRLIELASSGRHHQVQVDPVSLHRLIAWVDACCPYHGEPELRAMGDPDFPGIDSLPIRPRVATAPVIERP